MKGNRTNGAERKGGGQRGQARTSLNHKTMATEQRKREMLCGKNALLATWEQLGNDDEYVRELRQTVTNLQKTLPR